MHRILLHIGPLTIYSYGFMLALAFVVGTVLARSRARRKQIQADIIIDLVFVILVSSIIGARIFYVAINWQYYLLNPFDIIKVWEGGLVFYGGFIGGFWAAVWFIHRKRLALWVIADIITPSLAVGIALGRIGCFLNGCCYGALSHQHGIAFPCTDMPPVCAQQITDGLIAPAAAYSLKVIPTQLYSALFALVAFAVLVFIERYKRFEGFLFLVFVLIYSAGRFIIEMVRCYEPAYFIIGGLTVSQVISFVLFIAATAVLCIRSKDARGPKSFC